MDVLYAVYDWIRRVQRKRREKRILDKCGCIIYCPFCKDPLNDQASCTMWEIERDGVLCVEYTCHSCGTRSQWLFGMAPFPVCQNELQRVRDAPDR